MKKIANRVLALIVALTVLLMPAAMAAEQNMASISIGNFELGVDGEVLSLPVTLQLAGGADVEGARGMALVSLLTGEQTAGTAYGVLEDSQIKLYIDGMDYGLYIPLEDALAMLGEEVGLDLNSAEPDFSALTENLSPELEAALTGMVTAAAALETIEVDDETMLNALGVTLTDAGSEEIELFGETVSAAKVSFTAAPQTLQATIDSVSAAVPEFAAYWTGYSELLTQAIAATGEEIDVAEVLNALTVGAEGSIYTAETDTLFEVALSLSADGETIELPFSIAVREAEGNNLFELYTELTLDSETLYFYADSSDLADAESSSFSLSCSLGVMDAETEETESELIFSFETSDSAEGVTLDIIFGYEDGYDPVFFALNYTGLHAVTEGDATSWDGVLNLYAEVEGSEMSLGLDTNLTLDVMPEGELLTLGENSINLLEAGDDDMEQFMSDTQVPLMQLLGALMQNETIASLMSDMM